MAPPRAPSPALPRHPTSRPRLQHPAHARPRLRPAPASSTSSRAFTNHPHREVPQRGHLRHARTRPKPRSASGAEVALLKPPEHVGHERRAIEILEEVALDTLRDLVAILERPVQQRQLPPQVRRGAGNLRERNQALVDVLILASQHVAVVHRGG
ncbi:hypothetical protein GQ55_1G412100 [Panicum hallii var. hallii]|uniref:Uncharacterized protein n=1 Tax=Panicum hallii var. hallii TaxID=1504633 RepID=A0A2T7FCX3_9POAL|nr:hypothetical protein GQ55_1G412100 [Panicum hallii var. hallii]